MSIGASPDWRSRLHDLRPGTARLAADALRGLRGSPKRLAPLFFYDERGSELFERICELPEYYLTRVETEILRASAGAIARRLGERCLLVELGSGASAKTRLLLDRLVQPAAYVPVDISRSALLAAANALREDYPSLEILPVCADFTQPFRLPHPLRHAERVAIFFPGSTIGNFDPPDAIRLLRSVRSIADASGALLIGVDLVKDPARLEAAYDDASGTTAAFNLNVLKRLNRDVGADFALDGFDHEAAWVPDASRIEMRLVSRRRQRVHFGGETIEFARGERLVTEHCHKYTIPGFEALARSAGWSRERVWTDDAGDFAVFLLCGPPH